MSRYTQFRDQSNKDNNEQIGAINIFQTNRIMLKSNF